jgi:hemolysin D
MAPTTMRPGGAVRGFSRITAIAALASRYGAVFRQSWSVRRELDTRRRLPQELSFLPSHLEIIETPVHPAPRWAARICGILGLSVVVLAIFGRLDIVAVAPGSLVPNGRVKVIQPATTGVVRRILVSDGMRVRAGQLLMELDPTQAAADTDRAMSARLDAQLTVARSQALLLAQSRGTGPRVARVPEASQARLTQTQALADGIYSEYRAKIASLEDQLAERKAQLATTQAQIARLKATAPLAMEVANDYRALAKNNYVARHDYLERQQQALAQQGELAASIDHARELEAAIAAQQNDIATTQDDFRRAALDDLGKAEAVLSQARDEQTKAQARLAFMRLTAPVSGTVQQLAVHTVGGVVTTAEPLLVIVPDNALEVDAHLANKDIGFVEAGQPAAVKIIAFPYTRFGYLHGTVEDVSRDAVADKKGNLYFDVRIRIPGNRFPVGRHWVNLTPGMQVEADIHTGTRTVAEYFLSPLIATTGDALHER